MPLFRQIATEAGRFGDRRKATFDDTRGETISRGDCAGFSEPRRDGDADQQARLMPAAPSRGLLLRTSEIRQIARGKTKLHRTLQELVERLCAE